MSMIQMERHLPHAFHQEDLHLKSERKHLRKTMPPCMHATITSTPSRATLPHTAVCPHVNFTSTWMDLHGADASNMQHR